MDKLYIDCNIIIEWLAERKPFYYYACQLITMIENKEIEGAISPLTLANTYYILSKHYNKNLAFEFIKDCERIFLILDITKENVKSAINEKFKVFEDDLHYNVAKQNNK